MLEQQKMYIRSIDIERPSEEEDEFPFNLDIIKNFEPVNLTAPVTFFCGENGSGKSTLLEAVAAAWGFNPEGGSRNFAYTGLSEVSDLKKYIRLSKGIKLPSDGFFLRAESFYNFVGEIDKMDAGEYYGGQSLYDVSHGESFLAAILNRFYGKGLYLLDEPESALSPIGQFAFLNKVHQLVTKKDSQFIISTHSPIITAYPNAVILEFSPKGVRQVAYKDSDNYNLYRSFLLNENMLKEVLKLDEDR